MNFPVFSQLAGNFGFPETGWLETASSGGESANHHHDRLMAEVPARISDRRVLGLILESLGASAHSSQDPSR